MAKRIILSGKSYAKKCEIVGVQTTRLFWITEKHGYDSEYLNGAWDWPAVYFHFGLGTYQWAEHKQN